MKSILIVDDEKDIAEAVSYAFEKEGFRVYKAHEGTDAIELAVKKRPDVIILDIMLPGISGLDVCRNLRASQSTKDIPIIMLSARSTESDKVAGLDTGADDYLVKPFSMRELSARIKALIKRGTKEFIGSKGTIKFPELEIDPERHSVNVSGRPVEMTAKEFSLLLFLAENAEKVFSRERLLDAVWGIDVAIETRTVDVHMRRLREKLGKAAVYLRTLHGVGYQFSAKKG